MTRYTKLDGRRSLAKKTVDSDSEPESTPVASPVKVDVQPAVEESVVDTPSKEKKKKDKKDKKDKKKDKDGKKSKKASSDEGAATVVAGDDKTAQEAAAAEEKEKATQIGTNSQGLFVFEYLNRRLMIRKAQIAKHKKAEQEAIFARAARVGA